MKNILTILLFVAFIGGLSSCKKCTTCEVKDSSENIVYGPEETCGNDSQIEEAKDLNNTRAIIIGGTSSCIDK
jgi:hypothetical protein